MLCHLASKLDFGSKTLLNVFSPLKFYSLINSFSRDSTHSSTQFNSRHRNACSIYTNTISIVVYMYVRIGFIRMTVQKKENNSTKDSKITTRKNSVGEKILEFFFCRLKWKPRENGAISIAINVFVFHRIRWMEGRRGGVVLKFKSNSIVKFATQYALGCNGKNKNITLNIQFT